MTGADGSPALRVSFDATAIPDQPVGVGRFALDLVRTLSGRADVDLTVWARRTDAARWRLAGRVEAVAPGPRPLRLAWEQARLPALVRRAGVDLHHAPHYTMPERLTLPTVVTVHDLTFFDHPEWHERAKVPVFRRAITTAARRATAVLCDSVRTAEALVARCSPTGRVFVVPLGVDLARFRPAGAGRGDDSGAGAGADDRALRQVLGPDATWPYVLFLGTLEPRKAVPDLVAAFDRLADGRADLRLVLAGRDGWGVDAVDRAVAGAGHRDRIVRTGYVDEAALPALLRRAAAVAYPARVEGFGLPALEALACGTPLVTTAGTVMADLAGPAALTAAAGSLDDLAGAIEAAVAGTDGPAAAERRRAGLAAAAAHSWEACAQAHLAAYRWAVEAGAAGPGAPPSTGGPGPIR